MRQKRVYLRHSSSCFPSGSFLFLTQPPTLSRISPFQDLTSDNISGLPSICCVSTHRAEAGRECITCKFGLLLGDQPIPSTECHARTTSHALPTVIVTSPATHTHLTSPNKSSACQNRRLRIITIRYLRTQTATYTISHEPQSPSCLPTYYPRNSKLSTLLPPWLAG